MILIRQAAHILLHQGGFFTFTGADGPQIPLTFAMFGRNQKNILILAVDVEQGNVHLHLVLSKEGPRLVCGRHEANAPLFSPLTPRGQIIINCVTCKYEIRCEAMLQNMAAGVRENALFILQERILSYPLPISHITVYRQGNAPLTPDGIDAVAGCAEFAAFSDENATNLLFETLDLDGDSRQHLHLRKTASGIEFSEHGSSSPLGEECEKCC